MAWQVRQLLHGPPGTCHAALERGAQAAPRGGTPCAWATSLPRQIISSIRLSGTPKSRGHLDQARRATWKCAELAIAVWQTKTTSIKGHNIDVLAGGFRVYVQQWLFHEHAQQRTAVTRAEPWPSLIFCHVALSSPRWHAGLSTPHEMHLFLLQPTGIKLQ